MKVYKDLIEASKFSEKEPVPYHNDHGSISYCFDFEKVESVSALFDRLGINPDFSKVPPAVLARAKFVGDETHDCLDNGYNIHKDKDVQGCLDSYLLRIKKVPMEIVSTERSLCSKVNGVWVSGRLDAESKETILEWKTTYKIYETAKLQLAFYCLMSKKSHGVIVRLKKDGSYPELYSVEEKYIELAKKLVKATPEEAQKLMENKVEVSKTLSELYLKCKQEQALLKLKEHSLKLDEDCLKEEIVKELDGERGIVQNESIAYTFTKSKDSERKSWDTKKLEAYLAKDSDEYRKVSQVKGTYKVTTKEKKS